MIDLTKFKSVVQNEKLERTSDRYSFIPTTQIIDDLSNSGWYPVSCQEANARVNKGYQKHLIRFQNNDIVSAKNKFQPEIVLTNSHNGKASFRLMGGGINFVCLNGLIISDTVVADHTIRHQGYTKKVVKEAVYNIVEDMPKVYNSIDRFQDIKLDADQKHAFGRASLTFAYTDEQLEELDIDDTANRLMRPYRTEERDNTLWNAFNIAQEKLIRGGRFLSDKDSYRPKKKRATKDITKNVNINRALWAFTEAIADKLS